MIGMIFVLIVNNKILVVKNRTTKESKTTTGEWNERKAKTKLRSFLVLGVGGGC